MLQGRRASAVGIRQTTAPYEQSLRTSWLSGSAIETPHTAHRQGSGGCPATGAAPAVVSGAQCFQELLINIHSRKKRRSTIVLLEGPERILIGVRDRASGAQIPRIHDANPCGRCTCRRTRR